MVCNSAMGPAIPFGRRWENEGDWELFGHVNATPIRRPESKCCDELRRQTKALERTLAELAKRLSRIEADREAEAHGFESSTVRAKARTPATKRK